MRMAEERNIQERAWDALMKKIREELTRPGVSQASIARTVGENRSKVYKWLSGQLTGELGLPSYYSWRTRSGCTFCFFQQKIEWVRLKERHPEAFAEAKAYEKNALEHGSPFTWNQGESLEELEKPERVTQILRDHELRIARIRAKVQPNPLRPEYEPLAMR